MKLNNGSQLWRKPAGSQLSLTSTGIAGAGAENGKGATGSY